MKKLDTETTIADLVSAICGENATARERHLFREALRGLVRLAKSEQLLDMKNSVGKLTGVITTRAARRQAKAILLIHRAGNEWGQQQLEFNQR